MRTCVICRALFEPKKYATKQKTCCLEHSREHRRTQHAKNARDRRKENPERDRNYNKLWRARNPGYYKQWAEDKRARLVDANHQKC
jgi:hypothetical protein